MSLAKELFEKTNVLAGKLRKNSRVVISKPRRSEPDVKPALPKGHRYGPEDRPPPLSELSLQVCKKISIAEDKPSLAFCHVCNCDVPIKWKPRDKRGKDVESWFVCAICNSNCLEIKYKNREGK